VRAKGRVDGTEISARQTAEGKCVNTMVYTNGLVVVILAEGWKMFYLHVTNALSERRGDQHGCRRDEVRGEENCTELTLGQIELALEEVSHPGPRRD
jgi:hypothetical protein